MVDPEKVRLMTQAAIFEQKERNDALRIVSFRRKDYIVYHMLAVMLAVTVAYAVLVGAMFFMIIMAYDEIVLSVGEMILILAGVVLFYIVIMVIYYVIAHKYYGEKHVQARKKVVKYLTVLHELVPYQETKEREET